MNTRINPYRMLGRIDYAVQYLMMKYDLSLSQEVPNYTILLSALALKVDSYDSEFCLKMAQAAGKYVAETENASISQMEADLLSEEGGREAVYVFHHNPTKYADVLLQNHDFLEDMEREEKGRKKAQIRNIIIFCAIIAVIVGGIIVYNLPYFAEQRAYENVENQFANGSKYEFEEAVSDYQENFPEGKHINEVMYMPVRFARTSPDIIEVLDAVDNYLEKNPSGVYSKECHAIYDSIWDIEIARYKKIEAASTSTEGTQFVLKMLQYMKKNRIRSVEVVGVPELDLKEYKDYPQIIRDFLESTWEDKDLKSYTGGKPHLPEDMETINDKITLAEAKEWVIYVIDALQSGFDHVLTPGFIKFEDVSTDTAGKDKIYPKIEVNYIVSNQEVGKDFPDIWTYIELNGNYIMDSALYLGIKLSFDAKFTLPGEETSFEISGKGDPGSEDINRLKPALLYSKMCERASDEFALKIISELGLKLENNTKEDQEDDDLPF